MIPQCLLGAHTGLRVSSFALGAGRREAGLPTLRAFADAGGTFLDTASAYEGGAAEETIGEFLAEAGRDRFVIASKYGRTPLPSPPAAAKGNHRGALAAEIEGSLKRLRTDRIDLYFPHFDDGVTPVEEIMRGLEDLVRAGKIVHIGLSNFPAWRTAEAAMFAQLRGTTPVSVLQMQYNLTDRAIEREYLPFARARGLAVMGYSPLARGRLGKNTDEPISRELRVVADEIGVSPAVVALAWVRAQGVIPVLGARTLEQFQESLPATTFVLSAEHLQRLDVVSAVPQGYPYELLAKHQDL